MSTAYSSAKQQYIGNGVTTEWGFDFPIKKHSELKVYLKRSGSTQVLLEEGVDYSFVTENTIAFPIKTGEAKLQAADVLALQRESVFESEYNFSNQQRLEPEEVMHADDNLERQIQELKRDVTQAIRIQPTSNIDTDEYFIAVESIYENLDKINNVSEHSSEIITCSNNIEAIQDAPNQANAAMNFKIEAEGNANDARNSKIEAQNSANTAQTMATQAAQSASEAAQSATASANSANNSHIWAEGTDAQVQALGGVHSSKVWAQQSTNANIALTNSPYTTNRILEIPQDIKLELNNGTLTLKAGSKVYVPNGFEADGTTPKFDVRIIENDVTYTQGGTLPSVPTKVIAVMNFAATAIGAFSLSICSSGSGAVGNNTLHYRTDTNYLVRTTSAGISSNMTFPLAILTVDSTGISSIDQIFNGFGYIGSTVFALPGVKVQAPNGKNEDGSYKTEVYTTTSVSTFQNLATTGFARVMIDCDSGTLICPDESTIGAGKRRVWNPDKNLWTLDGVKIHYAEIGKLAGNTTSPYKITSVQQYTVDSVANSNASNFSQAGRSYLSGLGMPSGRCIDLTLGASGSTYTAPANGLFVGACGGDVRFENSHNGMGITTGSTSSGGGCAYIPVKQGDVVIFKYSTTNYAILRFIYAEGETNV